MPIRINLKEIFSSDPQEILVDKLNFNYNKLLELGVGTPGPIGTTGPQGAAGPIGLTGPQGDRGATWWVDSGDPNTLTFTGLIDGDMYLDQTSNVFQVWKYDAGTSTWVSVVSIAAIVSSYLGSLSSIPFETVTTFQNPGSTSVNKFILFDKRDDDGLGLDSARGAANTSKNNILFLNNFDEANPIYPTLGQAQYNSLLSIFPAHDDTQLSGKAQTGRYHIEMGSLYMDNDIIPIGTVKYSEPKHNLKVKFYKQYIDPALPPQLPATNSWINTAKFSLSYTEDQSIADIDQNAAFEFLFPKWNNEGMSPIREGISVIFASSDAIVEKSPVHNHIVADGIHVSTTNSSVNATFGLALDYSSLNAKLNNKNHLMLDSSSGVNGVILLNKGTFINGDANIVNGLAIGSSYSASTAPSDGAIVQGNVGIGTSSPTAKLHVSGEFRLQDGSQVADSYLGGDANGNTSFFPVSNIGVPTGAIMPYFGTTAPAGWLLCSGFPVLQINHPDLYAHLVANGQPSSVLPMLGPVTTTPNLRDRFIVGAGNTYALMDTGGVDSVTLDVTQIPGHTHTIDPHSHGVPVEFDSSNNNWGDPVADSANFPADANITSTSVGLTTNSTGGGLSHENRPPFYALTYIIKT